MSEHVGLRVNLYAAPRMRRRSRIHGKRILYVDDEHLMRLAVTRLLRGAGAVCVGMGRSTPTSDVRWPTWPPSSITPTFCRMRRA